MSPVRVMLWLLFALCGGACVTCAATRLPLVEPTCVHVDRDGSQLK